MLKSHLRPPAALTVAGITFLSLLTLVHIIQGVAAYTIHSQLLLVNILLFMTCRAFCLAVLAAQPELGITVVIKFNPVPGLFTVAVLALLSETTSVLVIMLVAGITIHFNLDLVGILLMAGLAGYITMASPQWKLGVLVMVEVKFLPALRSMAFLAILTIGALVHIIQFVAGITLRRCLLITIVGMTARTIGFGMTPG